MEGGEGGRGEYYTKIVGLRESISSTGAVVKELRGGQRAKKALGAPKPSAGARRRGFPNF